MQIRVYKDANQIAGAAATLIAAKVIKNPSCVLGLATGSTPLPTYNALIELYKQGIIDFSNARSFNLDEYYAIDRAHPQSYYKFMFDNLFSKINIKPENVRVPEPKSSADDCAAYDAAIKAAGGVDIQLLGIGNNGHIAFNEPAQAFTSGTHITELTQSTIEANKRFFNSIDEVPKKAITMGTGTIMKAKEIVLIATGEAKAKAVKAMITGAIDPICPASVLQLHKKTTVFLDEKAAGLL